MKVLIYSANFAPEPTGIGKYSGDMAAWLAERGHHVRVIAAPPYYPQWKIDRSHDWRPFRRRIWNGVEVWRAPLWVPKAPGGIARVLHLLSFAITSFPLMLRQIFWRPDLVLTVAPAFVCAPAGLLTARLCGAKAWLHLQDFEVDLAFGMGLLKNRFLKRLVLRTERLIMRRFDSVSSISARMVERLLVKGVDRRRTRYFPNWVDIAHVKPSLRGETYRTQLGIALDAVVVLFSGSLGGKQGLMVIPQIAELLRDRTDIVFVICGDGVMKPTLEAAATGMANVKFLPLQPFSRLGELLSLADIHLLPQSADAADLVLPSKLSGMLASGRPVISTCRANTELGAVIEHCGVAVTPADTAALAREVAALADAPLQRSKLGRSARAYAESHYERDGVLERRFGPLEAELLGETEDAVA